MTHTNHTPLSPRTPLTGPAVFLHPDRHAFLVLGDANDPPVITWSTNPEAADESARVHGGVVVAVPILADYRRLYGGTWQPQQAAPEPDDLYVAVPVATDDRYIVASDRVPYGPFAPAPEPAAAPPPPEASWSTLPPTGEPAELVADAPEFSFFRPAEPIDAELVDAFDAELVDVSGYALGSRDGDPNGWHHDREAPGIRPGSPLPAVPGPPVDEDSPELQRAYRGLPGPVVAELMREFEAAPYGRAPDGRPLSKDEFEQDVARSRELLEAARVVPYPADTPHGELAAAAGYPVGPPLAEGETFGSRMRTAAGDERTVLADRSPFRR